MRPRSALFPYQQAAVARASAGDELAFLLDPGDGKTVIILTDLLDRGAWPALVVAPASVVEADVWGEEARQWEHLQNLVVTPVVGTPAQRRKLLARESHVEVISYENLRWLTSVLPAERRYLAIAFDELSKLKAPGTRRFKRMRGRSARIPVRRGATGTPVANHLRDLWGEMYMVAGPKPLGPTAGGFDARYFEAIDYQGYMLRLKCCARCGGEAKGRKTCTGNWLHCECHQKAIAEIRQRVAPWVFALPPGAGAKKPPVRVVERRLPDPRPRLTTQLLRELWAELPSGATLEALSQSAIAGKLRQLAGGAVYYVPTDENGEPTGDRAWEEVHTAKLDALDDMLDELQGESALLFYWYGHERERLQRLLDRRGRNWAPFTPRTVEAWNRGEVEVMLMHPQSAGFGLNLQAGGHHVIWYSLPVSHEQWVQGNGRLARPGQHSRWVTATQLLCGSYDDYVAGLLSNKAAVEAAFREGLHDA